MKLLSITALAGANVLGISAANTMTFRLDEPRWRGWSFHVRGPSVIIETPPGWQRGTNVRAGSDRTLCEIPRTQCYLEWRCSSGENVDGITKHTEAIAIGTPAPSGSTFEPAISEAKRHGVASDTPVTGPVPDTVPGLLSSAQLAVNALASAKLTDSTSSVGVVSEDDEDDRPPQYRKKGK